MADKIYVIFDGPPGSMRIEDEHGELAVGPELSNHPWKLGPFYAVDWSASGLDITDLQEAEAKIERLIKAGDAILSEPTPWESNAVVDAWDEAKQ